MVSGEGLRSTSRVNLQAFIEGEPFWECPEGSNESPSWESLERISNRRFLILSWTKCPSWKCVVIVCWYTRSSELSFVIAIGHHPHSGFRPPDSHSNWFGSIIFGIILKSGLQKVLHIVSGLPVIGGNSSRLRRWGCQVFHVTQTIYSQSSMFGRFNITWMKVPKIGYTSGPLYLPYIGCERAAIRQPTNSAVQRCRPWSGHVVISENPPKTIAFQDVLKQIAARG